MGQICPRSVPSQHYMPTPTLQGQGNSTTKTSAEKVKLQSSQSSMESKVISRGASCTQDDIRRSFRKEKEKCAASPEPSSKAECVKQLDGDLDQPNCDPHDDLSRTRQHQRKKEKHRHSGRQSTQSFKNHDGGNGDCDPNEDVSKTNHQHKRPKEKQKKHRHCSPELTDDIKAHQREEDRDLDQHKCDPSDDVSRTHPQKRGDKQRHSGRQSKQSRKSQHEEENRVFDHEKVCDPHENISGTIPGQKRQQERQNKHRHSGRQSMLDNNNTQHEADIKEKQVKGHRHKHHRVKRQDDENFKIEKEDFEDGVEDNDLRNVSRYYMSHNTHEIQMKGSLLEIHVTETAGPEPDNNHGHHHQQDQHRHHHHHHHRHRHHHHRKSSGDQNQIPFDTVEGKRHTADGARTPKSVTQVECSTQNAHNAKISARRTHPPNSHSAVASSSVRRSRRDRVGTEEAPASSRYSSTKEKKTRDKTVREKSPTLMDPVYSLPPLLQ